ncbi:MAG: histidine phosphatase family protein [Planctomycetota bacterium]
MSLSPPPRPSDVRAEPERDPISSTGSGASVWLVRHGRVEVPTVAYGDDDVRLSEEGVRQTEAVARSFEGIDVATVVASPLGRARAMGEAVAGAVGAPLRVDGRWAELHRGAWQGLRRTEYAERWAEEARAYWRDTLGWRGHGGESEVQLFGRAWPALVEVVAAAGDGVGVVAAHRQVIRAVVAAAIGVPPGRSHALALDPAHAVLLRDTEAGWVLERTNVARPGAPRRTDPEGGPPEDVVTQMR